MGGIWGFFLSDCDTVERFLRKVYCQKKAVIVLFPPPLSKLQSVKSSLLLNAALQSLHCEAEGYNHRCQTWGPS